MDLGWTMWEFCQSDDGRHVRVDSASRFLAGCHTAPGVRELIPFARRRLRAESLDALQRQRRGMHIDHE